MSSASAAPPTDLDVVTQRQILHELMDPRKETYPACKYAAPGREVTAAAA